MSLKTVILSIFIFELLVAVSCLDENRLCQKLTVNTEAFEKCSEIIKKMHIVEEQIGKAIADAMNNPEVTDENKSEIQNDMVERITKLRETLDRINNSSKTMGFPGLMNNMRWLGMPLSKWYALYIFLDPFEI